ncbi:MAG TPA: 50S ribosomal protein L11 methyltransferase [Deferrisomatales bacterium]|nr:50S ribosomal protein L11 methyltransferase [Deferrisomatales bacterium]
MSKVPVWWKVTVLAAPEDRELLDLLLAENGAGGVIEAGEARVAYFAPEGQTGVEEVLATFAADRQQTPTWHWEREEGEPWRDAWKEHFRPALLSPRLAVCPSWCEPPVYAAGVEVLRLDPGRAFGTGTHETTRLCLRLLDRRLAEMPVQSCLDVGCGSGILSVAVARLGVSRVVALDIDPQAAAATRENAACNGVERRVAVLCGDLRAVAGSYPLVVANILYQILLGLAPVLTARVAPGGVLVLSGLLEAELGSAARVYGAQGLSELAREVDGEWGALVLERR